MGAGHDSWPRIALKDLVDERGITYGVVQPGQPVAGGVPIVRVNNIAPGGFRLTDVMYIAPEIAARYERSRLRGGEVLITLVGSVGNVAVVPAELAGWNVARAVGVVPVREGVSARWVAWCLQSPEAQRYLDARLNTTVQKTLNLRDLATLEIPMPSREAREVVAAVLGALDDKIASNGKLAARLGEIMDVIFDHSVVHARSEDWDRGDLTTIAQFINGKAFTKYASHGGRPVLRIKELNSGISSATVYSEVEAGEDNIARPNDLLFSWSGSLDLYRWHGPESLINQHIFKVIPRPGFPDWFVAGWIRHHLPEFQRIARDKATTMGHIKREHLKTAAICIPPKAELRHLNFSLAPLVEMTSALASETLRLTDLRTDLLPKLLSGQRPLLEADVTMPELVVT